MNLKEFYDNLKIFYKSSAEVFEKLFDTYTFVCHDIGEYEKVYVVEDSFIVYFGIKNFCELSDEDVKCAFDNNYGRVSALTGHMLIVEELTYNDVFKINATKLKKEIFRKDAPYAPYIYKFYNGNIDKPIRNLNFIEEEEFNAGRRDYLKTNFYDISKRLPFLNLKQRVDAWKGVPYTFIIYEVEYSGKKGYAVNCTTSPYITKFVLSSIRKIEKAIRWIRGNREIDIYDETLEGQFYTSRDIEGSIYYNFPYSLHKDILGEIICWNDALFREILLKKLDDYYIEKNTNIKKCQELSPSFITDNFMRYWTYTDYLKDNYFPDKLIDIMRRVDHYISKSDETIEYHKTKNRWKSEELMYESVKKVFSRNEVVHQHRPYFLHTRNGQMSYDVFVYGEKIAFEYQGKQHFEPVEYFGGKEHFEEQRKRDELKLKLSKENGIILIYVNYWEDITTNLIKEKVVDAFKQKGIIKNKYYLK